MSSVTDKWYLYLIIFLLTHILTNYVIVQRNKNIVLKEFECPRCAYRLKLTRGMVNE